MSAGRSAREGRGVLYASRREAVQAIAMREARVWSHGTSKTATRVMGTVALKTSIPAAPSARPRGGLGEGFLGWGGGTGLVFVAVDEAGFFEPGHHFSELSADFFNLVVLGASAHGFEGGGAGFVFQDEFAGEGAGLDFAEDAAHFGACFVGDDSRAAGDVAVFGGV